MKQHQITETQINNWKRVFPFLQFCSDELVKQVVAAIQARIDQDLFAERFRKEVMNRTKSQLKSLIRVGTVFTENGETKKVSRVTDIYFDSVSSETGDVQVRNLGILAYADVQNSISIVTL